MMPAHSDGRQQAACRRGYLGGGSAQLTSRVEDVRDDGFGGVWRHQLHCLRGSGRGTWSGHMKASWS